MTGQELFSLIQGLTGIVDDMDRFMQGDEFRLNADYTISGYDVEKYRKRCSDALELIENMKVLPGA